MVSQNIDVFVKIFTFMTSPLKVPNIVIFSSIRNDIGSNFVERINEWFFGKRYSISGKNGAIKKLSIIDMTRSVSCFVCIEIIAFTLFALVQNVSNYIIQMHF